MSVLIEGLTLVIRKLELEMRYPGGAEAFGHALLELQRPPRFVCIADDDLVNIGYYDAGHVSPTEELLEQHGLTAVDDRSFVDFAFVDQHHGPSMPCSWLEWKRHSDGFTFAWLAGTDPSELAVYDGWTPETSRGMKRFDVRDDPDRLIPLGEDEELEYALDLKTGHVMAARPHRELDPADGPLPPSTRGGRRRNTARKPLDLSAIIAELEMAFPEGPLLSVVRQVLTMDDFEFDRTGLDQMQVRLLSDLGDQVGRIQTDEEECYVRLRITLPTKVAEEGRLPAAEAVARANHGLLRGTLELDVDDGEIGYRDALVAINGVVHPDAIRTLLYDGIYLFDRYIPAILEVAQGLATAAEAIARAEAEDDDE